jgi:hypothetical protein
VLTNLRLKPGALDILNLPISVQHGYLGELRLKIPFSNLSSEPCVAELDRIFLVARSKTYFGVAMTPEEEAIALAAAVTEKLDKLLKHELTLFGRQENDDEPDQESGFAQRFAEKVIDNLQLHVGRVHIRYEYVPPPGRLFAGVPTPVAPFAMGVTIHELSGAMSSIYSVSTDAMQILVDHSECKHPELSCSRQLSPPIPSSKTLSSSSTSHRFSSELSSRSLLFTCNLIKSMLLSIQISLMIFLSRMYALRSSFSITPDIMS